MKSNREEFIDNGEHLAITRIELSDGKVILANDRFVDMMEKQFEDHLFKLGINLHPLKINK